MANTATPKNRLRSPPEKPTLSYDDYCATRAYRLCTCFTLEGQQDEIDNNAAAASADRDFRLSNGRTE